VNMKYLSIWIVLLSLVSSSFAATALNGPKKKRKHKDLSRIHGAPGAKLKRNNLVTEKPASGAAAVVGGASAHPSGSAADAVTNVSPHLPSTATTTGGAAVTLPPAHDPNTTGAAAIMNVNPHNPGTPTTTTTTNGGAANAIINANPHPAGGAASVISGQSPH
jgi:hypothetical protein